MNQKSYDFYHNIFGFKLLKTQPEQNSIIIGDENVKICMYEVPYMKRYSKAAGFNHFGICVDNFDQVMETLIKNNVAFQHGEVVFEWEKSNSIYIYDPTGYGIDIVSNWGGGLT
jgi:catechol-2,3-dioxygenase